MKVEERILIIDDDISLLKSLESLLRIHGYQVSVVKSGKQAEHFLEGGNKPDLILLDVDMPEINGYELIQILKGEYGCENIPVIYLTTMEGAEFEIKGLELGAVDYITKPFVNDVLIAHIKRHIQIGNKLKKMERIQMEERVTLDPQKSLEVKKELTDTEYKVAKLIALGYSNQEIAKRLNYSYGYVKKIASQIYEKLGTGNRNELRKLLI